MMRFLAILCTLMLIGAEAARADVFFTEGFDYSDGNLTSVSGGLWSAHSGAGNAPVQVSEGLAVVAEPGSEDVNRFSGGPTLSPGNTWYYGLQFTVIDNRPTPGEGEVGELYFAHFKDAGTANFRGRLYMTPGSDEAHFSLGIESSTQDLSTHWGSDLSFDTPYTVVVSYTATEHDPRTDIPVNPVFPFDGSGLMTNPDPQPYANMDGWATLWVNPASSASTSVTDMPELPSEDDHDVGNDLRSGVDSLAVRQSSSFGLPAGFGVSINFDTVALGDEFDGVLAAVGGSPGTPGDYDADGDVDGEDFLEWQRGNSPTPFSAGDLSTWESNYPTPIVAAVSAVPEPTSLCLLALALTPWAFRRK